jgi:hypothetical protein
VEKAWAPVFCGNGECGITVPNGALEISIPTVRGQSVAAAGGQLAYRVTFRGQPMIQWSNLGLILEGASALGPVSGQPSSQDETWRSVQGKANPIRNHYNAVAVQTPASWDETRVLNGAPVKITLPGAHLTATLRSHNAVRASFRAANRPEPLSHALTGRPH